MQNEDVPLAPVTGWTVAPISAYGAVFIRLQYLSHATQAVEEAQTSPAFVIHTAQCRELIAKLQKVVEHLESGLPPGTGLPKH